MDEKWEVFETPDVDDQDGMEDEVDARNRQDSLKNEAVSEDVDVRCLPPPEEVFEVFAGRRFVGKPQDVDNGTGKDQQEQGGYADQERKLAERGMFRQPESPFERYNRLRSEVEELANDLKIGIDQENSLASSNHSQAYTKLADGVTSLRKTLDDLKTNEGISVLLSNQSGEAPENSLDAKTIEALNETKKTELFKTLENIASKTKKDKEDSDGANAAAVAVKYELFLSNEQAKAMQQLEAEELNERVNRLEKILGLDTNKPPHFSGGSTTLPLVDVVSQLEERIALLDEGKLSLLSQKAKTLSANVEELTKARRRPSVSGVIPGAAGLSVEWKSMLEKLERCDGIATTLPALVERLRTVQSIHQHNANVHGRLDMLDQAQIELLETAKLDRQLLENLQESIRENMEIFQSNLAKLQS